MMILRQALGLVWLHEAEIRQVMTEPRRREVRHEIRQTVGNVSIDHIVAIGHRYIIF